MNKKTKIQEEFQAASVDANGGGAFLQDPVGVDGSTDLHGRMPGLDNKGNTDAPFADAPGVGDKLPRAAMIQAIVQMLAGMSDIDISKIVDESGIDLGQAPASGVADGTNVANLASVHSVPMKEEIESLFAGEDLSDEFKAKIGVVFESAVNMRLELEKVTLTEQVKEDAKKSLETLTETVAETLEKYTSFVAEQFVENNKIVINETIESVVAQNFMVEMFKLVSKYNVDIPERSLDIVGSLQEELSVLKEHVETLTNKQIELVNENASFKRNSIVETISESLTPLQRSKFKALAANITATDTNDFESKALLIKETVESSSTASNKTTSLLNESNDGISQLEKTIVVMDQSAPKPNSVLKRYLG